MVIGGEGTLGAAARLADEGVRIVGVPKTIDNDLAGTDVTVGFHTAVQVATDAIDRLHSTAESHDRVMLVEVMGRHSGWIAVYAGMAGGADAILIPEQPFDLDGVCHHLRHRHASRSSFSIVVVAEGAVPVEGTLELPEPPLDENGFPEARGPREPPRARDREADRVPDARHDPRPRPARGLRPSRSTGCWRRDSGSPPRISRPPGDGAGWSRGRRRRCRDVPIADAVAERNVVPAGALPRSRGLLRVGRRGPVVGSTTCASASSRAAATSPD